MSLEDELGLDISPALAAVDQLEERVGAAAEASATAFSEAMASAVDSALADVQALADLSADALSSSVGAGMVEAADVGGAALTDALETAGEAADGLEAPITEAVLAAADTAQEGLSEGISGGMAAGADAGAAELEATLASLPDAEVGVEVDATAVDELSATLDAATTDVTIGADATEVTAAEGDVRALIEAEQEATTTITVEADATGLDQTAQQATDLGGAAEEAAGQSAFLSGAMGGLASRAASASTGLGGTGSVVRGLVPGFGLAAVAGTAFAGVLDTYVNKAINADAASRRFQTVLGAQASAVEDLSGTVPGLNSSLGDLAVKTGSSASNLRSQVATFFQLGVNTGVARDEVAEYSRQQVVLANYLSATNPKLGTADEVLNRLGGALARGGRFAANFGINVGTAGEIADKASEMFGKPANQIGYFEKQVAGLQLVMQQLGPTMNAGIAEGAEQPIVVLRRLEAELTKVLVAGSKPLIQPLIEALEAAQPVIIGAAEVFTGLASGVFPIFAAEAKVVGDVLGLVADVLDNRIVQAVLAGGGAFLVAEKSATLLLSTVAKIGPKLAELASSFSLNALRDRFTGMVTGTKQAEAGLVSLQAAFTRSEAATAAYRAGIERVAAANVEGIALQEAYNEQLAAQQLVMERSAVLKEADAALTEAEAAANEGAIGSEEALTTARVNQATASAALMDAETGLAVADENLARTQVAAAGTAAGQAVGLETLAVEAEASSVALGEAAVANEALAASSFSLSSIMGPLAIVLGVGAAAWAIWSASSKESKQAVEDASKSLDDYRDSLGFTNRELAAFTTADARREFAAAGGSADDFRNKLEEAGQLPEFNDLGLSIRDAGAAINGSDEAAKRFRQSLIDVGQVDFSVSQASGDAVRLSLKDQEAALEAVRAKYVETGSAAAAEAEATRRGIQVRLSKRGEIVDTYTEQARAAKEARDALLEKARSEIHDNDATSTANIATAAATGLLSELTPQQEAAARALLRKAEATKITEDADRAATVAATQFGDEMGRQVEAVGRVRSAMAEGVPEQIDVGDLGAARALAASAAFDQLPEDVQKATKEVIDYADEALKASLANGDLTTSTGEVGSSLVSLTGLLGDAIDKYDQLSSARGQQLSDERDIRGLFDSLGGAVEKYGKELDDTKPKTVEARDNARQLADTVQGGAAQIRTFGENLLKQGVAADDVKARMKFLAAAYEEHATKAGLSKEQVEGLLHAEGLLPGDIDQNFQASGLDEVSKQLQILNLMLAGLPPDVVMNITAIDDATEQAKAIEEAINDKHLPPEKAVALRAILDSKSVNEAQTRFDTLGDPIETAIRLGLDPAKAKQADTEIREVAQARGVTITASAETIQAVADLDGVIAQTRTALYEADDAGSAARLQTKLDGLIAQRTAIILAEAHDDQANSDLNNTANPGGKPRTANVTAVVTPAHKYSDAEVRALFGIPTTVNAPPSERGRIVGAGGVTAFAAGGSTVGEDELLRRIREGRGSDRPGFYPPGARGFVFAEDSTAGEYFISRKATDRGRNAQILGAAAADFGYDLVPTGTATAPIVNVQVAADATGPELLAATQDMVRLLDANLRAAGQGGPIIDVGGVIIEEAGPGDGAEFLDEMLRRATG